MRILQVLFDFKNKNIESFNEKISSEFFTDTIIVDFIKNKDLEVNVEEYDYIIYSNPNFYMDTDNIISSISKMEDVGKKIVQTTLRDSRYIKDFKYNAKNYRDLFSNLIIKVTGYKVVYIMAEYFERKLSVSSGNSSIIVQLDYIGRDLRNNMYKEDLIKLFIELLKHSDYNNLIKSFENNSELIRFIDFIIDNKVFEKNIDNYTKTVLLENMRNKLKDFGLLTRRENTPLYLFYALTMKGYYDEAINALTLFRSRRYWYNNYNNYVKLLGHEGENIRLSDEWRKTQKLRNLRLRIRDSYYILEKHMLKIISNFYKKISRKEIWIISERVDSASDNSYFLYEYLRKERKDIKSYYLIDKNAKVAINKLRVLGNILYLKSIKHKFMMLIADKFITSFTFEETMTPYNKDLYLKIYEKELQNTKIISIQHGMIIHNISPYLSKKHYRVDYITANNQYEKEIIMDTLGFRDEEVLITGMARHDNLLEKSTINNEILFMPTWQRGLQNLTPAQFIGTEYYKKIFELINHPYLYNYLKENNLRMNVLMHPQFEKYSEQLKGSNEYVQFQTTTNVEIPDLIAKSKFLITDFSSVSVDFLFQKKNVIFYQYNKYASHHVPSKQIKYENIGEVVSDLDGLFKSLDKFKDNQFQLLGNYEVSYEKLFEFKRNIRQTIVNKIKNLR